MSVYDFKRFKNLFQTSYKFHKQTRYIILMNFLQTSYDLLVNQYVMSFVQTSFMNFLDELFMNF